VLHFKSLRFIMRILPAAILILWVSTTGHAATTLNAATCALNDVLTQVNLAVDGDTVALPSCSGGVTWTSTLLISKAITLQGATCTLDSTARPTSCGTVIIDAVASGGYLISWTLVANQVSRMSNIEVRDGGVRPSGTPPILFQGQATGGVQDGRRFRLDHCRFLLLRGFAPWVYAAWGVLDHNYFDLLPGGIGTYFYEPAAYAYSDAQWTEPTAFGSDKFLVIEDNTYTRTGNHYAATDAYGGARMVVRNNLFINSWVEAHGTESAARARGTRALEIYGNTFTGNNSGAIIVNQRSGPSIVFNNTATNFHGGTPAAAALNNERVLGNFAPYDVADGTSRWDINDSGNPKATFTATSGTNSSVTVTGAAWTTDQWRGYTVHKVGCVVRFPSSPPNPTCGALVSSNTATTLNLSLFNGNTALGFSAGEQFQLNLVSHVVDGPCRSGGSLLVAKNIPTLVSVGTTATATVTNHGYSVGDYVAISDASPLEYRGTYVITATTPTTFSYTLAGATTSPAAVGSAWATKLPPGGNDQVTDPCYQWLNRESGNNISFRAGLYGHQIRPNEHYYDYTPSFNGTAGMGSGLGASKPGTCTAGVGYWATDEGEWDSTHNGPDGNLYTCTAPNTWAVTYTPYTYPHPLTASAPTLLNASPIAGTPGAANLLVSLTGQATNFVNGTTASFGAGITVNSVTVSSATNATANISIAGGATVGVRNVTVTTGAEVVTATNAFVVLGVPTLTTLAPNSGAQGTTVPVTLTGTLFVPG